MTPLHALIGPNDSGKSTILRAVETLAHWAAPRPLVESKPLQAAMAAARRPEFELSATVAGRVWTVRTGINAEFVEYADPDLADVDFEPHERSKIERVPIVQQALRAARMFRLEPDNLRAPGALIVEGVPIDLDERGVGLAAALDAIVSRQVEEFTRLRADLIGLFPTVKNLRLINVSSDRKALRVELTDGTQVDAAHMSEGLLYYLAFAILPYLAPTSLLLIEEPENGLHPARIRDVMKVLRRVSEHTQVLLATHSPLVVNELEPDEASVVTRPSNDVGTQVTPLRDTHNFEERSAVYSLGELWVSYADGETEAALLEGKPHA
ncbi:MAG: ATP-binding protein [Polyangiaceae bacterium]